MHDYKEIISELKEYGGIESDDIFEYEYSPLKDIYNNYFEYCQENLLKHCNEYAIQPARFYYRNGFQVNARAGISNGFYVIGVNMGTIRTTYNLFYEKNNIFESDEMLIETFSDLGKKINVPLGFLMYQIAIVFTYHHELAHLVQKSPFQPKWLTEHYKQIPNDQFSIQRHVVEFDADLHGAHAICYQLLDYFKKLSAEDQTGKNLIKILSLGIASIYSYFMLCFNRTEKVYYREFSHPHPLIRISYVLDCFVRVADQNLPLNSLKINQEYLLRIGLTIADVFFKAQPNSKNDAGEFQKQLLEKIDGIENYINELVDYSKGVKNLLMNRS